MMIKSNKFTDSEDEELTPMEMALRLSHWATVGNSLLLLVPLQVIWSFLGLFSAEIFRTSKSSGEGFAKKKAAGLRRSSLGDTSLAEVRMAIEGCKGSSGVTTSELTLLSWSQDCSNNVAMDCRKSNTSSLTRRIWLKMLKRKKRLKIIFYARDHQQWDPFWPFFNGCEKYVAILKWDFGQPPKCIFVFVFIYVAFWVAIRMKQAFRLVQTLKQNW